MSRVGPLQFHIPLHIEFLQPPQPICGGFLFDSAVCSRFFDCRWRLIQGTIYPLSSVLCRPSSVLRIYGIARTRAFRALWIANELALPYEHVPVEIGDAGARRSEYLALNPNGRLPAIEDDGFVLWESLAITLYLAKKHSLGRLYPATLEGEAKAWQWSFWAVQEVDRGVNIWSLHALRLPAAERDAARRAEALKVIDAPFRVLDGALAKTRHLLGDDFTVADLNVAAVISRAIEMDLTAMPHLSAWLRDCLDRPAARAALSLRAAADAAVPVEVTRAIARNNRL